MMDAKFGLVVGYALLGFWFSPNTCVRSPSDAVGCFVVTVIGSRWDCGSGAVVCCSFFSLWVLANLGKQVYRQKWVVVSLSDPFLFFVVVVQPTQQQPFPHRPPI
jgi:hypothetical protein